jgi:hypothetical protein
MIPRQKIVKRKSKDTGKTVGLYEELQNKDSQWSPEILKALKKPQKPLTYRQMVNLWKKAEEGKLGRPYTLVVPDLSKITDAARRYAKLKKIRIFTNTQWRKKNGWMEEAMNA